MLRFLAFITMFFFSSFSFALSTTRQSQNAPAAPSSTIASLWQETVSLHLRSPLWEARDAYDAGHLLLLPVISGSGLEKSHRLELADFFRRFEEADDAILMAQSTTTELQFYNMVGAYLVSLVKANISPPPGLQDKLINAWTRNWNKPAPSWGRTPFPGGTAERIQWILDNKSTQRSYYRALVERELYGLGIASQIAFLKDAQGEPVPQQVRSALKLAAEVLTQEFENTARGFVFQSGVWADHPDYAYAGNDSVSGDLNEAPVKNITQDTSHSHRLAALLWNLSLAPGDESAPLRLIAEETKMKLARQLRDRVIMPPTISFPGVRTTNFMDGQNGIYRYKSATKDSPAVGYGAFELSGTFLMGWWSLLENSAIHETYQAQVECFPLAEDVLATYRNPAVVTRDRHPSISSPIAWEKYMRLLTHLAASKN